MRIGEFYNRADVTRALNLFAAPLLLSHELAHWLPARLLGLRPGLHWRGVAHDPTTPGRELIVTMGPTLLGIGLMAIGAMLYWHWASTLRAGTFASLVFVHGLAVFVGSGFDWVDAWRLIARGREANHDGG